MKIRNRIMNAVFLPCTKATLLVEKKVAGTISLNEKMRLAIHNYICVLCKAYEQYSFAFEKTMNRKISDYENIDSLSNDKKQEIIRKISHK